ncbi:O-antigen ligase family protein [Lacticaseibacillus paracasei]|uniref:O-antigen ligase family protein n=1 Tax=Lacticaseibacillus paracasei TaxID=1597 RepID=UPI0021A710EB|nr:O-antigen ligase family protein [Lacticaseibacillus paracasei]MCT3317410.1 O-antigen ligase domain-containing protein [Lacticaseibacillus paracasei]
MVKVNSQTETQESGGIRLFLLIYFFMILIFGLTTESMINPIGQDSPFPKLLSIGLYFPYYCIMLLAVISLFQKRTFRNWIFSILIFMTIGFGYFFVNRQPIILLFLCLAWSSQTVPYKKLVKADFWSRLLVVIFLFFSNLLQILPVSPIEIRDGMSRLTLGFRHPNGLAMYLMMLMIECFYLYSHKKFRSVFLLFVGGLSIYFLTDSRGSFLALISFAILVAFSNILVNTQLRSFLMNICLVVPVLSFIGSLFTSVFLSPDSRLFQILNDWMSGRPELLRIVYDSYAQKSFFGHDIPELANDYYTWSIGTKNLFVDNQYMYALMIFGWFGSVAEVLYALYCSLRAKFFQDESLLFWLTAMALFGIAEHKLLVVDMAVPFLCLGKLTSNEEKEPANSQTDSFVQA